MMRLLFLCLLLLQAAVSEEREGSGNIESDDEDYKPSVRLDVYHKPGQQTVPPFVDEAKGKGDTSNELMVIIIVVAATVLALSVAAIVITLLVRRRMHNRQQGIYSVPADQDKKGDI